MKNYSQTFVKYRGCGTCYLDGTNMLIGAGSVSPTNSPFWKRPIDSNSKIAKSTRNKPKRKSRGDKSYMLKYAKFVKKFHKNEYYDPYFNDYESSDTESSDTEFSDIELKSNIADNESTAGNDQKLNKL